MKYLYLIIFALVLSSNLQAQVGIGTTNPEGALDVSSLINGFIPPRVSLTSTIMQSPILNPNGGNIVTGTIVWNTNTAGTSPNNVTPGLYYWDTFKWYPFSYDRGSSVDGWPPSITDAGDLLINTTKDIIITGEFFTPGTVLIIPDTNVTLNSFTIDSPTQITANVTSGTLIQSHDATITNIYGTNTLTLGIDTYNFVTISNIIIDGNDVAKMTYDGVTLLKATGNNWAYGTIYSTAPAIIINGSGGVFSFKVDNVLKLWASGIDSAGTDEVNLTHNRIDFAFISKNGSATFGIKENGTVKVANTVHSYAVDDVLEIRVDIAGAVTYWQNGTLLYTSSNTVSSDMNIFIDIYHSGMSLSELIIN